MSPPEGPPASRRAWLLTLLVAAAAVVPFWTCRVVPTQDGAAHLYNAWLLLHLDDPALQAGRFFRVNPFVPNWGGVGPLVPLLLVAPPAIAEKLFFSLLTLALVLGAAALAARLGGDPVLASAAAVSIAHGWLVAMGFTGFVFGLGLGLGLAAWAAGRVDAAGARTAFGLAAGFALVFFVHLAAAAIAAALVAVVLAARWEATRPRRRLAALGAPFVALALLWVAHVATWPVGRTRPAYRPDPRGAIDRLLELPTGAFWQSYSVGDRALGAAVVILVLGLVLARAAGRGPSTRPARALLLAWPAVLAAYLAVPSAAAGGAFLTDRLVPLLLLLPLPWATSSGLPRRRALRAAALLLAAGLLAQRGAQYRSWGLAIGDLVERNRGLEPGTLLVQAKRSRPGEIGVDPLAHLWGRVAIEARAIPLDDYEAALVGWFPVAYTDEGQALSVSWTIRGEAPPGAAAVRTR